MTTTPTTTLSTPRVWIGCLHCYNSGRLVGERFDCTEAADVDLDAVHTGQPGTLTPMCEELWCFDTENIPVPGEMDPLHAAAWGEAYEEVGETLWPAYCAWMRSGMHVERADGTGAIDDFEERYCGHWDSFQEYANDYVDSTGLLREVPEHVTRYFDYEAHARDLQHDYTVVNAVGSGVYIFRNF